MTFNTQGKMKIRYASLCTGIGGWDTCAQRLNMDIVFQCEIDLYCQLVLTKHFPNSIKYHDLTKSNFSVHRGGIDILTASLPCTPFSVAGKRKGSKDERHLWGQCIRAIKEIQPTWFAFENSSNLINIEGGVVFEHLCTDLENEGYEVSAVVIPAGGKAACHKRERLFIIAYSGNCHERTISGGLREKPTTHTAACNSNSEPSNAESLIRDLSEASQRRKETDLNGTDTEPSDTNDTGQRKQRQQITAGTQPDTIDHGNSQLTTYEAITKFCNVDDELSRRLDGLIPADIRAICTEEEVNYIISGTIGKVRKEGIKAGGNAVYVPVVHEILKAISLTYENS